MKITIKTKGNNDILNITNKINEIIEKSNKKEGIVHLFVIGSTAGLTTIEYEPNLVKDFQDFLNELIPANKNYKHNKTWNDNNGHSHIRASLLKPDLTIPFENSRLLIGEWQQIVLIDFDTRPREREIIISIF
ncbi:secondary thiamine-phosphate synthase enzyme YjbQ [Candidatus Pacearchaeota archaeon]|nr:secondary thiamine-phosphate synthase enzyme YjbQ [Candidatus Pacearchaeota archaeon]